MIRCLILLGLLAVMAAGEPALWSLAAASQESDPAAAGRAVTSTLQAGLAGRQPRAIVFLDYRATAAPGSARAVGDAIAASFPGIPVLGTSGTAQPGYALAYGAGDRLGPSLVATAIGGDGLRVGWAALGATRLREYGKDPALAGRVRELRAAAAAQGAELVGRLPPAPAAPGQAVIVFGAAHNDWHVPIMNGVRDALPQGTGLVGGVGQFLDEVYADGTALRAAGGSETDASDGLIALRLSGRFAWAAATERVGDGDDGLSQLRQLSDLARSARARLPTPAGLTVAMTTIGLSRGAGRDHSRAIDDELLAAAGGGALLGAALGGEAGLTADGLLSVGGGRIALLLLSPLPE